MPKRKAGSKRDSASGLRSKTEKRSRRGKNEKKVSLEDFEPKLPTSLDTYKLPKNFKDEEIDEDMAFNAEDYAMYGDVGKNKIHEVTTMEDYDDNDEELADDSDVEVDLSEMVDIIKKNTEEEEKANQQKKAKKLKNKEKTQDGDEDSDVDGNNAKKHDRLLEAMSRMNKKARRAEEGGSAADALKESLLMARTQFLPESDLGVAASGDSHGAVTLEDLLDAGDETAAATSSSSTSSSKKNKKTPAVDKKTLDDIKRLKSDAAAQQLSAPLSESKRKQLEREIAFNATKKHVSRWTGVIKSMREAPQLKFPLVQAPRMKLSTSSLASTFTPTNDLEKDFSKLLEHYGMNDEKKVEEREQSALLDEELSQEARNERTNQLRKTRSLMFRHEIKLKRLKKIKSRTFRKLAKRRKEKQKLTLLELEELDPELAEAEKKKIEAKRVQERMSLRHKNTSKWVKRQLRLAKGNPAMRGMQKVIGQQLNIGNDLRKKMDTMDGDDEDDDDDGEEEELAALMAEDDDDSGDEQGGGGAKRNSAEYKLAKIKEMQHSLKQGISVNKPKKGLLSMKFMQRAMEKRAQRAAALLDEFKAEIEEGGEGEMQGGKKGEDEEEEDDPSKGLQSLSKEHLQDMMMMMGDEDDSSDNEEEEEEEEKEGGKAKKGGGEELGSEAKKKNTVLVPGKKIDDSMDNERRGGAAARKKANSASGSPSNSGDNTISISDNADSDDDDGDDDDDHEDNDEDFSAFASPASSKGKGNDHGDDNEEGDASSNPWVRTSTRQQQQSNKRKKKRNISGGEADSDGEGDDDDDEINIEKAITVDNTKGSSSRLLLDQAELIHDAFANGGGGEEEFAEEKRLAENPELGKEEETGMPGWGTWGGEGARKPRRKRKLEASKKPPQKAKGPQHVIVNNKRNKKAKKYTIANVPYPFTSKQQYEQSLRHPLGRDWNTQKSYHEMTKPEVITKMGTIIDPISVETLKKHAKGKGKNSTKKRRK